MVENDHIAFSPGAGKSLAHATGAPSGPVLARRAVERLESADALALAWVAVDPEELAAVLRQMPPKVRNRMLSANRVPSSKVTVTTARLLLTNINRRGGEERYRVSRLITSPFARDAEEVMHGAVDAGRDVFEALEELVHTQIAVEGLGPSMVVLCALSHAIVEPSRFLEYFVAAQRAGIVPRGSLDDLATELTPVAEVLVEEFEANHRHDEIEIEEFAEAEDAESKGLAELLASVWEEARDAARRVHAAVRDGELPDPGDLDVIDGYVATVEQAAEVAGVEPTIRALAEDAKARDVRASLRTLSGPAALAEPIGVVKALIERGPDIGQAERLEIFARLVAEPDPMKRMELAGRLRPLLPPPPAELVDAALAGLLQISATPVAALTEGSSEESVAPAAAAPVAVEEEIEEAEESEVVAIDKAAEHMGEPSEPEAEAALAPEAEAAENETVVAEGVAEEKVREEEAAAAPAELERRAVVASAAMGSAIPPTEAAAGEEEVEEILEEEAASEEEVNATLAHLVALGRFDLAHHLAAAADQGYRAAISKEAALAEAVRTPSSPASAEMVLSASQTTLHGADLGSVVLRSASEMRVALLDPGSGAPSLLREVVPFLDALPTLREVVGEVLSATEQMVAVSASGVALDVADAIDQAQTIASWAQETIDRPPRRNRLYRGVEIWKSWTAPDGLLGKILALLAANDPASVAEVRAAYEPFARRAQIERAVEDRDRELRAGRPGKAQKIIGPAKEQLIRHAEEIVAQAQTWCDAQDRSKGSDWSAGVHDSLAQAAGRLRSKVLTELTALGGDPWLQAAATASAASIGATLALLTNEALSGEELSPAEALNACLALVVDLPLDTELSPKAEPTTRQLVAAASRPRRVAFESRLDRGDFFAAEAIIDLRAEPGDDLDAEVARAMLARREREAQVRLERRWGAVEVQFSSERARGRISEDEAPGIYGALLAARPRTEEGGERRDLGDLARELDGIEQDLVHAVALRYAQVTTDVNEGIKEGGFGEAWNTRLRELLRRNELGAAEEYLHRAQAGESAPSTDETEVDRAVGVVSIVEAFPAGLEAGVVTAAQSGTAAGPLDFSPFDDQARTAAASGLDAWLALSRGERPGDLNRALTPVLGLLGLIPQSVERPQALRTVSGARRWYVDVLGEISGYAFVPDFGSRSRGRRRFMLCWDTDLPMSQLWDAALTAAPADAPVYVLYMGMLSAEARRALARESRTRATGKVVVIDDAVVALCAAVGRGAWDVTMRAVLPYAAPNPYDPEMLVNTPTEMFYGRRLERQKVMEQTGTSFISGGRRFGKSALLRAAEHELTGSDVTVLLVTIQNVAAVPPHDPDELWSVVGSRLVEAGVLDPAGGAGADAVAAGIRAWLAANPQRRLLLLLDECDFFLKADSESRFRNVVILRDLMSYDPDGRGGRFKVVFSGLQHVARYRKLPNQPLSHLPQPLVIGPLDPSSASRLVRRPLRAMGWQISDAQIDRLVTFCACNPSVLQLACMHLVNRLRRLEVTDVAPWEVPDRCLDELLHSAEIENGVRDRLDLTLRLDHRYKLLANLVAWRALDEGEGGVASASELRTLATEYWPEGFAGTDADDVRALCDELVGLGVFAGDAEAGYRMLSPATIRLFGSVDDIANELMEASETYIPDIAEGAAGSRIEIGGGHYSPLTAGQLADVIGMERTQLRIVVGSRALRGEAVPAALAKAVPTPWAAMVEATSLRQWREAMTAPREGHRVVVADMTGRSHESWNESIDAARRRGGGRSAKGTRAAVLVAGPSDRWLLSQLVASDAEAGELPDLVVGLRRIDAAALRAWDRIEELELAHPKRQARLLEVTGGWPYLVERVIAGIHSQPFDVLCDGVEAHLATPEGAAELVAAVGLDPDDPDQPVDPGVLEVFERLVEMGWHEAPSELAELLEFDDEVTEPSPAEAVAILGLLAALEVDDDGNAEVEPVLAAAVRTVHRASPGTATLSGAAIS